MKKFLSLFLSVCFAICVTACNLEKQEQIINVDVLCTVKPVYDWVKTLIQGTEISVGLLGDGADIHSYQPTADDIIKIYQCDLLVYIGGESDKWVEESYNQSTNKNQISINLLEVLGDRAIETPTLQEKEHHSEYDEHIWLSLKNANILTEKIANSLTERYTKKEAVIKDNYNKFSAQLINLDKEYDDTISKSLHKTMIFADRFPFIYLAEDYDIDYYAAFSGCSTDTDASFSTIATLASKVDELSLKNIIIIEGSSRKIAQAVIAATKDKNQEILILDSMQSVDIKAKESYLEIMKENLETIRKALN